MKKRHLILILVLLQTAILQARKDESRPVTLLITLEINARPGTQNAEIITLIPATLPNVQEVLEIQYSRQPGEIIEKDGNRYARFVLENPAEKETITITAHIDLYRTDLKSVPKIPAPEPAGSLQNYRISEPFIESNHPEIENKLWILKDKNNQDIRTLENIYDFIHQQIQYGGENPYLKGALPALQLMQGGSGDCSDLFAALCRAAGFPTRTVTGIKKFKNVSTPYHWNEVYLEKRGWITFDPTYFNPDNNPDTWFDNSFPEIKNDLVRLSAIRNDSLLEKERFSRLDFGKGKMTVRWIPKITPREE